MPYISTLLVFLVYSTSLKNETQRNIIYIINRITHPLVILMGIEVANVLMTKKDSTND